MRLLLILSSSVRSFRLHSRETVETGWNGRKDSNMFQSFGLALYVAEEYIEERPVINNQNSQK